MREQEEEMIVHDPRCDGTTKPVDEHDAVNTARCRVRSALLVLDAFERQSFPSLDEHVKELSELAAKTRPLLERELEILQIAFKKLNEERVSHARNESV